MMMAMKRIYYFTSSPGQIAAVNGTFSSSESFNSFDIDTEQRISVATHIILWSGDSPGDGVPAVVKKTQDDIVLEKIEIEKDEALFDKLDEIDTLRENRLRDGELFTYENHLYHIDRDGFNNLNIALGIAPIDYTRSWKTADKEGLKNVNNVYVTLNKDEIKGLLNAFIGHYDNMWDVGDNKKKEVKEIRLLESSTVMEIEEYDVSTGWGV